MRCDSMRALRLVVDSAVVFNTPLFPSEAPEAAKMYSTTLRRSSVAYSFFPYADFRVHCDAMLCP